MCAAYTGRAAVSTARLGNAFPPLMHNGGATEQHVAFTAVGDLLQADLAVTLAVTPPDDRTSA